MLTILFNQQGIISCVGSFSPDSAAMAAVSDLRIDGASTFSLSGIALSATSDIRVDSTGTFTVSGAAAAANGAGQYDSTSTFTISGVSVAGTGDEQLQTSSTFTASGIGLQSNAEEIADSSSAFALVGASQDGEGDTGVAVEIPVNKRPPIFYGGWLNSRKRKPKTFSSNASFSARSITFRGICDYEMMAVPRSGMSSPTIGGVCEFSMDDREEEMLMAAAILN